jgi:hypothetical protein
LLAGFIRDAIRGASRDPGCLRINFMNERAKIDIVHYALKEFLIFATTPRFALKQEIVQADGCSAERIRFDNVCARIEISGVNFLDDLRPI